MKLNLLLRSITFAEHNISYEEKILKATDVDPQWTVIGISKAGEKDDVMSITFAKTGSSEFVFMKVFKANYQMEFVSA